MPTRCCVLGCRNNYGTGQKSVPIFKFPRDLKIREQWLKSIERTNFSVTKYTSICIDHFEEKFILREDKMMRPDGTVLIVPRARVRLTDDAYPTKFGKSSLESTDSFESFVGGSAGSNSSFIKTMKTEPTSGDFSNENYMIVNQESSMTLNENTELYPEYSNNDLIPSNISEATQEVKSIGDLCRICLESTADMWAFSSVLTYNDGSTFDIVQAFLSVTCETDEEITRHDRPKHICSTCVELLRNAYNFHNKYQETLEVLNGWVQPRSLKSEKIDIIDENIDFHDDDIKPSFDETNDEEYVEETSLASDAEGAGALHRCPICSKKFTAVELRRHCRSHKTLQSYMKAAPKFNKKVKFFALPRRNNISVLCSDRILHRCPYCGDECDKDEFKFHIQKHRVDGTFKCKTCHRVFPGKNHLKMHELSHKREAPFQCEICRKPFFKKINYEYHKLIHTNPGSLPFKCNHCEKAFYNPEHLKRHIFEHSNPISYNYRYKKERYECLNCLRLFQKEESFFAHECKINCSKCKTTFITRKDFKRHPCRPTGEDVEFKFSSSYKMRKLKCKKTLCYVCGKDVVNIYSHMNTHYPKSSVKCVLCDKSYRSTITMRRHIKQVHYNLVKVNCRFCNRGFKSKWNCQAHEKIHTGERLFVCDICGKAFGLKATLMKHLNTHSRFNLKNIKIEKDQ